MKNKKSTIVSLESADANMNSKRGEKKANLGTIWREGRIEKDSIVGDGIA